MKLGTPANYYIQVGSESWTPDAERAALYAGTYELALNQFLVITFVDDLTEYGPPWLAASLPSPDDKLTDPGPARLIELFSGNYVVTPNDAMAGRTERFRRPWDGPETEHVVVFYVTRPEFAELLGDLDDLSDIAGRVPSGARRDDLLHRPVLRLVEERVLVSPWLAPRHAKLIGRAA